MAAVSNTISIITYSSILKRDTDHEKPSFEPRGSATEDDHWPALIPPQQAHQPRPFQNNGYLPNGVQDNTPSGQHNPQFANQQQPPRVIQSGGSRILCVADVRGLSRIRKG
jgi:hypothetical protein